MPTAEDGHLSGVRLSPSGSLPSGVAWESRLSAWPFSFSLLGIVAMGYGHLHHHEGTRPRLLRRGPPPSSLHGPGRELIMGGGGGGGIGKDSVAGGSVGVRRLARA